MLYQTFLELPIPSIVPLARYCTCRSLIIEGYCPFLNHAATIQLHQLALASCRGLGVPIPRATNSILKLHAVNHGLRLPAVFRGKNS